MMVSTVKKLVEEKGQKKVVTEKKFVQLYTLYCGSVQLLKSFFFFHEV